MGKILNLLKNFLINNKFLLLILFSYLILRTINLLTPPVFNDEAIYLDWGWRETSNPGYLYYSLYDAKQPLLMWIFGIMQHLLWDPLFAGRIVSVFTGLITLIGIFKISENLFNKKTAYLASILYIVIPIFSFFDRQALMESSIAAVGVWSSYLIIKLSEKKSYLQGVVLGFILGIGFFIKSSSLLFLVSYLVSTLYLIKLSSKKGKILEIILLSLFVFIVTIILLIVNPQFWSTFSSNSRFTLTISEILSFPIGIWFNSIFTNFKILFFYFTPLAFILSLIGIFYIFKKTTKHKIFLIFFTICLLLETFTIKGATDRYLVSFIPFLTICASYFVVYIFEKNKNLGRLLIFIAISIPLLITSYQLINFPGYLINMGKISGVSNNAYLISNTSGYGINEVVEYFKGVSKNENIVIGIAQNTGNPESGLQIYFNKAINPKVVYLDLALLGIDITNYKCLRTGVTTYFVSRDNQQGGLEKFFIKVKTIKNPYGQNTIGIYTLKTSCTGKVLEVQIKKS